MCLQFRNALCAMMVASMLLAASPSLANGRTAASGGPSVVITPPNGARFANRQLFDIRIEYTPTTGATLTSVSLAIDGVSKPVTVAGLDANLGLTLRNQNY